jgi:hypothetical protein
MKQAKVLGDQFTSPTIVICLNAPGEAFQSQAETAVQHTRGQ